MSTGTSPSSFALIAAGSGGGVGDTPGTGVANGEPLVLGLLPPPHAAATRPAAPTASAERRDRARDCWDSSGGTGGSLPSEAAGQPTTVRRRTSRFDKSI